MSIKSFRKLKAGAITVDEMCSKALAGGDDCRLDVLIRHCRRSRVLTESVHSPRPTISSVHAICPVPGRLPPMLTKYFHEPLPRTRNADDECRRHVFRNPGRHSLMSATCAYISRRCECRPDMSRRPGRRPRMPIRYFHGLRPATPNVAQMCSQPPTDDHKCRPHVFPVPRRRSLMSSKSAHKPLLVTINAD